MLRLNFGISFSIWVYDAWVQDNCLCYEIDFWGLWLSLIHSSGCTANILRQTGLWSGDGNLCLFAFCLWRTKLNCNHTCLRCNSLHGPDMVHRNICLLFVDNHGFCHQQQIFKHNKKYWRGSEGDYGKWKYSLSIRWIDTKSLIRRKIKWGFQL